MPNWCENYLRISDKNAMKYIIDSEEIVDFNLLVPMPESLNVTEGSDNEYAIYVYLSNRFEIPLAEMRENKIIKKLINNHFSKDWIGEIYNRLVCNPARNWNINYLFDLGKTLVNNYLDYGSTTWYDWCCRNWGVKWNACVTRVKDEYTITFSTPWGPPLQWLEKLAAHTDFNLVWNEEGGARGRIYGVNGEVYEEELEEEE